MNQFIFRILLLFSCVLLCNCKKKTASPGYTAKMGGVRHWHHYYSESRSPQNSPSWDTSYTFPDTSFAIAVMNDSTINVLGHVYVYEQTNSFYNTYYFGDRYNSGFNFFIYGSGNGVVYYYKKDSIAYGNGFYSTHSKVVNITYTY
jgi:hypothetical protein